MKEIPPLFAAVFAVAFLMNAVYVGSIALMTARLRQLNAKNPAPGRFDGDWSNTIGMLGFLFGGEYRSYGDPALSRWLSIARIMFPIALVGTLTLFAWAGWLMLNAPEAAQ